MHFLMNPYVAWSVTTAVSTIFYMMIWGRFSDISRPQDVKELSEKADVLMNDKEELLEKLENSHILVENLQKNITRLGDDVKRHVASEQTIQIEKRAIIRELNEQIKIRDVSLEKLMDKLKNLEKENDRLNELCIQKSAKIVDLQGSNRAYNNTLFGRHSLLSNPYGSYTTANPTNYTSSSGSSIYDDTPIRFTL